MKDKKGILIFAFNNPEIDYVKMACCCALSAKSHLDNIHVTLVTSEGDFAWANKSLTEEIASTAFDNVEFIIPPSSDDNIRTHYDSPWTKFKAPFINGNRVSAYEISPYEETLLIDVDYLILSNRLDLIWNNKADFLINKNAANLRNENFHIKSRRLNPSGIPMYWATVIYFKKNEAAKKLFDLASFVKDHYSYYKNLYKFPGELLRNDYIFSIAMHILNGFIETDEYSFPIDSIKTMTQKDDIVEIHNDSMLFLSNDDNEPWKNILVNVKNNDIHIMNKRAFIRNSETMIKTFLNNIR